MAIDATATCLVAGGDALEWAVGELRGRDPAFGSRDGDVTISVAIARWEAVRALVGEQLEEIEALRDFDFAGLPTVALIASIHALAELIVGPAPTPSAPETGPTVAGPDVSG